MTEPLTKLGQALDLARAASFVGRSRELATLEAVLADDAPQRVVVVYGPGGVGKSTLLDELERRVRARGLPVARADAEVCGDSPSALKDLIAAEGPTPTVFLLDGIDDLGRLEGWLRRSALPALPANTRCLIAARSQPSAAWRADPAWRGVLAVIEVPAFSTAEALAYLASRGVPARLRDHALEFTHRHPLALALTADVLISNPASGMSLDDAPDLVFDLVRTICGATLDGDDDRARDALHVAAIARVTTESLLRHVLGGDDARRTFDQLERRSFMRRVSSGVVPHDLVRDLVASELARRDPERSDEITARVRAYYQRRPVTTGSPPGELGAITDLVFLHRRNPAVARLFAYDTPLSQWAEPGRTADLESVAAMLELLPATDVRWVRRWATEQPESLTVFRDGLGEAVGFESVVRVDADAQAHSIADPIIDAILRHLVEHAPLRAGEHLEVSRAWSTADGQTVGPTQSQMWLHRIRAIADAPSLAASVVLFTEPAQWAPAFEYMGFSAVQLSVRGAPVTAFLHDWRQEPAILWADRMGRLALGESEPGPVRRPPIGAVLRRDQFSAAVKKALSVYPDRVALGASPLARSALVLNRLQRPDDDAAEILATLIEAALDELREQPRRQKAFRAMKRLYVTRSATQAEAAASLGMPFSTFRRQLGIGIDAVTDKLWRLEVGAAVDGPDRSGVSPARPGDAER